MKYIDKTMHNPLICPFCGQELGEVISDDGIEELYVTCNNCGKSYTVIYNNTDSMYDKEKIFTDIVDVVENIDDKENY